MLDGQALLLAARRAEEREQREPLAICVRVDERFVCEDGRRGDGAGRVASLLREIRAREVLEYLFVRDEEESLVLLYGATDVSAKLLAVKVLQGLAVGRVSGQGF